MLVAAWIMTALMVVVAAVIDYRRFRVPNLLTFPLCASGLVFHGIAGGLSGLQASAQGLLIGGLLLMLFYVLGVMGAGDVKLLAGVGAWLGASNVFCVFLVAALAAGVYSVAIFALQRRLGQIKVFLQVTILQLCTLGKHLAFSEPVGTLVQRPDRRWRVMPFAVMIAIGLAVAAVRVVVGDVHGAA
jgi:prepilin peptidase CpaA